MTKPRSRSKKGKTNWLSRWQRDPFVRAAKDEGLLSRAAFKLEAIAQKHAFLPPGATIIDLGAAPGGWSQMAARHVGPSGRVIAIDKRPFGPIKGVDILCLDLETDEAKGRLITHLGALGGPLQADVVLADLAPPATGHRMTDHLRSVRLVEEALALLPAILCPGGNFLTKTFQGAGDADLFAAIRSHFAKTLRVKPPASRSTSREFYILALDFHDQINP